MKRTTLSGLAALTLFDIAAAHAQAPPALSWTGFYVGGNAGYRWADVNGTAPFGGFPVVTPGFPGSVTFSTLATPVSFNPDSGVVGVHAGYNYQYNVRFLFGIEGDFGWGKGSSTSTFLLVDPGTGAVSTNTFTGTVDWSASVRGRFGYVNGPWLLYGTGGISFLQVTMGGAGGFSASGIIVCCGDFFTTTSSSAFSLTKTLIGPVFGAGVERLFPNNWMVRVEYLVADYGKVNFGNAVITSSYSDNVICHCTVTSTSVGAVSATVFTQTLRFAISKKFP